MNIIIYSNILLYVNLFLLILLIFLVNLVKFSCLILLIFLGNFVESNLEYLYKKNWFKDYFIRISMTRRFENDEERKSYYRNAMIKSRAKKLQSVEKAKPTEQKPKYQFNVDEYLSFFENIENQSKKSESVVEAKPTEQKTPKYQFDSMEEIITFLKAKMQEDSSIKQQLLEDDNQQYIIESVEIPIEDKEAIFTILQQQCLKYGYNYIDDFDIKKFIHTDKKKEYFSSYYIRYKNGYGYYTEDGVQFTTDINAILSQYKIFPKYKNLIQKWLE